MNAIETTVRDLLNTMRDAARRLENGADPDDVAEFLKFSAEQYAKVTGQ